MQVRHFEMALPRPHTVLMSVAIAMVGDGSVAGFPCRADNKEKAPDVPPTSGAALF